MSNYYHRGGSQKEQYDRRERDRRRDDRRDPGRRNGSTYSSDSADGQQPGTSRMQDFGYHNNRGRYSGHRDSREDDRHSNRGADYRKRDSRGKKDKHLEHMPSYPQPKKLNPQEEAKRKIEQLRQAAVKNYKKGLENFKDQHAHYGVLGEDEEEEDEYAQNGFRFEPNCKRRRSRSPSRTPPRRRRTPTPPREEEDPEILARIRAVPEARASLERFIDPTRNMDLYFKRPFIYGIREEMVAILKEIEYGKKDSLLRSRDFYIREYHPQHSLFLIDSAPLEERVKPLEDKYIDPPRPIISMDIEENEPRSNFPRIFESKISEKVVENKFRIIIMENDGVIPISVHKDDFEESWQIKEREEREEADRDQLLRIRVEFDKEKMQYDDEIVQAELYIRKNPKDFKGYLEFCKATEHFHQSRTIPEHKPGKKMRDCLRKGMDQCPGAIPLHIELGRLIFEDSVEFGKKYFEEYIYRNPLNEDFATAYLDIIQYTKALYCSQLMEDAFRCVEYRIQYTRDNSHGTDPDLELFAINIWIRHLQWLIESGYVQRAVASIQASFESSYFYTRQGTPPFQALYECGAPRLGDKAFNQGQRSYDISQNITIEEEEIREEMEREKEASIIRKNSENLGKGALFTRIQRFSDEIASRPIRCPQASWIGVPPDLSEHLKKRTWIPFKELLLLRLRKPEEGGDPLYILKHFGISIGNESCSYSSLAAKYGLSAIRDALPLQGQMTLLRIFSQILTLPGYSQYTADLPANIVAYCSKAYSPAKIPRKSMELLDQLVAVPSRHREPEINEAYIFLVLKELLRINMIQKEVVIKKLEQVCQITTRNSEHMGSELWGRIAFSYMVMLAGVMSSEELESHLPTWLSKFYFIVVTDKADCLQILSEVGFLPVQGISDRLDPLRLISSLPCTTSLSLTLCTFLLNSDDDRSRLPAIQQLVQGHIAAYPEEKAGTQELHYAMVKYMETTLVKYGKSHKQFFYDELLSHVSAFPSHQEGIQLFLKHLKSSTALIFFYLQWKSKYPCLCSIAKNLDKNASEFEIFTRLALFDRTVDCQETEAQNSVDHYLSQQLMKIAEKTNEPNMWRLALKKANGPFKQEIYELARNKCVWSKALYLDYMTYKQDSPVLGADNTIQTMTRYNIPNIGSI